MSKDDLLWRHGTADIKGVPSRKSKVIISRPCTYALLSCPMADKQVDPDEPVEVKLTPAEEKECESHLWKDR